MTLPYFDYAATTPLDPRVAAVMAEHQQPGMPVANPSSTHPAGRRARAIVEAASNDIRQSIGVESYDLVWTSGATEADNLAILGVSGALRARQSDRRRILLPATEHSAVLAAAQAADEFDMRSEYLPVAADGKLDTQALEAALNHDVALVSVSLVNNETGVIQDIPAIAKRVHAAGALLHVDAAQAAGRLPLEAGFSEADLLVLSGHKFYGPKGIGALFFRPSVRLAPIIHGGGQQKGLRSGTLPVPLIAGMAEAYRYLDTPFERDRQRALWQRLRARMAELGAVVLNSRDDGSPHILNVSFPGVHGQALRGALADVAVGFGSACSSREGPSHVLRAMARPDTLAHASVRFSLGRYTAPEAVEQIADTVCEHVRALRAVSPIWREIEAGRSIEDVYAITTPLNMA